MSDFDPRPGEIRLPFDPAAAPGDAHVLFIGHIRSPWATRSECPRNLRLAREAGKPARVELDPAFRPGLAGLEAGMHIILLYWMNEARRDLIVQRPRHSETASGTFALRSPVRPNPIALALVRILRLDAAAGIIEIDAIDCIDGTPLLDIKPWIATIDAPVGA
jgi:tRNA-Thr(GGU) m(6)t(6)A37 methyltransferase TsaA